MLGAGVRPCASVVGRELSSRISVVAWSGRTGGAGSFLVCFLDLLSLFSCWLVGAAIVIRVLGREDRLLALGEAVASLGGSFLVCFLDFLFLFMCWLLGVAIGIGVIGRADQHL